MSRLLCMLFFWMLVGAPDVYAQDSTLFFVETFDGVTPPDLPAGWTDGSLHWETNGSVSSPGSGLNNLRATGAAAGTVQTATIDLSGMTAGTLQYLARRTSSYEQDSLFVTASVGGDTSVSILILDKGLALPAVDAAYELVSVDLPAELLGASDVVLQFEALGGSTSGANIRIDDVEIIGTGEATPSESVFGFSADSSAADPVSGIFEVPLLLDFTNAESLQGIQFDIAWDTGVFSLTDVIRGGVLAGDEGWQINFDSRTNEARVVLLGEPASALTTGVFDPLITLQFTLDSGNTADITTLTLSNVLGALSVRSGEDAGLGIGLATHVASLTTGGAEFTADVSSLDFGAVDITGAGEAAVTVTNTGTADLVVSSASVDNGLFAIEPTSATLATGAEGIFIVSFSPTFSEFGFQAGNLLFEHNAAGGADSIFVVGVGTGGRGDANEDGLVDAVDLVAGIDYTLDVVTPDANQLESVDVHPFALPDGAIDVRDLTVMSQAIVLNLWPDDSSLPAPSPASSSSKLAQHDVSGVFLEPVTEEEGFSLYLNLENPVRAIQFALNLTGLDGVELDAQTLRDAGAAFFMHHNASEIRVLGAHLDGKQIDAGRYRIMHWASSVIPKAENLGVALAVSVEGLRLPVGVSDANAVDIDHVLPSFTTSLGQPYPNPFIVSNGTSLNIPFVLEEAQHVDLNVYDILGRQVFSIQRGTMPAGEHQVSWHGIDTRHVRVAPGMYLLQLKTANVERTRVFVVQ